MDFRILGPVEALHGGRSIGLGGDRQRALLAVFLLHPNETLSTERLVDELWGERPPATATKTAQVYVSRLRKALSSSDDEETATVLATREGGYELRLDPERLDAHRFERLLSEGRRELGAGAAEAAVAKLERALALWRGAPLANLAYEAFAQGEAARLQELRASAHELLIEARLALGESDGLIPALEALIAEHPYRERLRAQLMLALYRADRQAGALQAYQDARTALVADLGIEPGERLRELERAVLAQDPALALAVPERRPRTPAAADQSTARAFVGRERELAELLAALEDAFAGRGRLCILVGEPGIGKSRLAEELVERARDRGARVLVGRCWEAGGAPAYWPWVQALRPYVQGADPALLGERLGGGAPYLAELVPELREGLPDLPAPPAIEPEAARFRLFEAVAGLLRAAGERDPIVLVLDDLHAADAPSLLLLRFVARELGSSRVLVVAACRDADPAPGDALAEMLGELAREQGVRRLGLRGLGEDEVAEYVETSADVEPPPGLARAIHAETDGNPLFVAELVRLLDAEGSLVRADAHLSIPPGVSAVIARRVGRLPEEARELLSRASVLGRELDIDVLGRLGSMPRDELLDVLERPMAERLLSEVPDAPGRLRFAHALIGDALYGELTPGRRMQLHAAAVEAIEAVHAGALGPHLADLARHCVEAGSGPLTARSVDYARRAGDRAVSQLAYEEAVRLYEAALAAAGGDGPLRCDLLLALGDAQGRAGDAEASKRSFRDAASLAERLDLPERLAWAALGYGGRYIWDVSRDDPARLPLLEQALAAVGEDDSVLRIKLIARIAGGPLRDAGFPAERRRALAEEGLAMARRLGDPGALAYALSGHIAANHSPEGAPRQVALASELLEVAASAGDAEREAEAREHRASALLELGDIAGARADIAALDALAGELGQPAQEWYAAVWRALLALLAGELASAEPMMERARELGEQAMSWSGAVSYGLQLFALRREQGRLGEVEDLVGRSVAEHPTYPIWRCAEAFVAAELGREDDARRSLAALTAGDLAPLPFDEEWLVSVSLLAETASAVGDAGLAAPLYARLLPYADRIAVAYPEISVGSVSRYLGLLAATAGRWEDAEGHYTRAREANAAIGARPWLARTLRDQARMLLGRGAAGDRDRARELSAEAARSLRSPAAPAYGDPSPANT
ncbi:MAG: BTAD domain-containing putative transcriptional regulator [Solirubrobacteraceae bacterium]